jgi:hypothetical protein
MSMSGRTTAKRKIQIRKYVTQQSKNMQHHCDPFLPEDEDAFSCNLLSPNSGQFSFGRAYVPDNESVPFDDILTSKINLDEADRFIAALRLPARKPAVKLPADKLVKLRVITSVDLATFRAESEKLQEMKLADSQDPPEEDDETII